MYIVTHGDRNIIYAVYDTYVCEKYIFSRFLRFVLKHRIADDLSFKCRDPRSKNDPLDLSYTVKNLKTINLREFALTIRCYFVDRVHAHVVYTSPHC